MCVTSSLKTEGDQPPQARREGTFYLLEHITLGQQDHRPNRVTQTTLFISGMCV